MTAREKPLAPGRSPGAARHRPFVLLNLAMTADAKIATASRKTTTFGSPADVEHLYELRATSDALLCGARTLMETDATLGNGGRRFDQRRVAAGLSRYPIRVLVTGTGSITPRAPVWSRKGGPIVVLTTAKAGKETLARLSRNADWVRVYPDDSIDFVDALAWLQRTYGVRRVLGEGGGELNDALFRSGLVDEINLTWCPWGFGGRAAPTLSDGIGFPTLGQAAPFRLHSLTSAGNELFLVYRSRSIHSLRV